jgi:hypothetical protein
MDNSIFVLIRHLDAPWIAADFAILNEAAVNVGLNIDFHPLAAKRTRHNELVCHLRQSYCKAPPASGAATNGSRSRQYTHRGENAKTGQIWRARQDSCPFASS